MSTIFLQNLAFCQHSFFDLRIESIYIKERCLSVCLSVCLFGFGAQTTGKISTKFGMGHPLVSVGNLEILFWVDPPGGYNFGKTKKIQTVPVWPPYQEMYPSRFFVATTLPDGNQKMPITTPVFGVQKSSF